LDFAAAAALFGFFGFAATVDIFASRTANAGPIHRR
jgi:hypothetical protein